MAERPAPGCDGISHTRWAAHGGATDRNAHPHADARGDIALDHNGVIENYAALKHTLHAQGVKFRSDTEALAHLVSHYYCGLVLSACSPPTARLRRETSRATC